MLRAATVREFTRRQPGTGTRALGWDTPGAPGTGAAGERVGRGGQPAAQVGDDQPVVGQVRRGQRPAAAGVGIAVEEEQRLPVRIAELEPALGLDQELRDVGERDHRADRLADQFAPRIYRTAGIVLRRIPRSFQMVHSLM